MKIHHVAKISLAESIAIKKINLIFKITYIEWSIEAQTYNNFNQEIEYYIKHIVERSMKIMGCR